MFVELALGCEERAHCHEEFGKVVYARFLVSSPARRSDCVNSCKVCISLCIYSAVRGLRFLVFDSLSQRLLPSVLLDRFACTGVSCYDDGGC